MGLLSKTHRKRCQYLKAKSWWLGTQPCSPSLGIVKIEDAHLPAQQNQQNIKPNFFTSSSLPRPSRQPNQRDLKRSSSNSKSPSDSKKQPRKNKEYPWANKTISPWPPLKQNS